MTNSTDDKALEAARAAYEHHQDVAMDQQHSSVSAYIDALENAFQAMQARADAAEIENDRLIADAQAAWSKHGGTEIALGQWKARAEKAEMEMDEARLLVAEANNSLYGSQGYFHSLDGGPFDKHHLANGIEKLKATSNSRWQQIDTLTNEREAWMVRAQALQAAEARVKELEEALGECKEALLDAEDRAHRARTVFTGGSNG